MASTTSFVAASATKSNLMNRCHKRYSSEDLQLVKRAHSVSSSIHQIAEKNSLQADLLNSLDSFIASIESKLDRIENFFTSNKENSKKSDDESIATLQNLYDTLITIKNSAFAKSSNLESLETIIEEHYSGLLSSISSSEGNLGFHEKLLTCLHFLDAKINQFNSLVENEAKYLLDERYFLSKNTTSDSIRSFEVKFHNYEHAMVQGRSRTLHYYELPFPWRENKYIVHGYRFQNNHFHAIKSICSCHNETSNIWSHLLGAVLMLYISFVSFPSSDLFHSNTFMDNLIMYIYLGASIKCLLSSTFWHTFNGTSSLYLRQKFACVDYTGITILITAAIIASEYAALYHFHKTRIIFITFSSLCGIGGFFFNWSSFFDLPEAKPFRVAFFLSLSGLGFSAFSVLAYHRGFTHALEYYSPIGRSSIWYLIGVVFYSSLIPERFRTDVISDIDQPEGAQLASEQLAKNLDNYFKLSPTFTKHKNSFFSMWWVDYVFASHNIWHIFVLLGILGHYAAIYEMLQNIDFNK